MAAATPIYGRGSLCIALTGAATHAAGTSCGYIKNPEGVDLIITDCYCQCLTSSTGAANLTAGFGATVTAGHDTTDVFAAAALAAAAGTCVQGFDHADSGDTMPVWDDDGYIVCCTSADASGFTGYLHVRYLRTETT
jgi:hypothetical protein